MAGQMPQTTQTSGGSGCFVCTAYIDLGWLSRRLVLEAVKAKLARASEYEGSLLAYVVYGPWLAKLVLKSKLFARWFFPICCAVLYEEIRLARPNFPRRLVATMWHWLFTQGRLPGRRRTTKNAEVVALLNRHNLNFGEW
jgi:hypothetical protein